MSQQRLKEALIRGAIWAFIGLLYAMLFVFLAAFADHWQLPIDPNLFAGVLAGTLGALIYSSMRLSVLMTTIISPISIFYFILSDHPVDLLLLVILVSIVGAVVGALYGSFSMGSRVNRADAKTLAGFCAGWLASLLYLLLVNLTEPVSISTVVALLCPLTGILYVTLVPGFIKLYDNLLPPVGDGLMVGVGVSGFIALCFFVMIGSIDDTVAGPLSAALEVIQGNLPDAMVGGIIGAGLAGIVSGLLLTNWQDL
jgi:dolichol kinase